MESQQSVVIVGAGIVGSALAHFLAKNVSKLKRHIVIIDRSLSPLEGSTALAPGLVGQFNESEVLTRLAIDSVEEYRKIPECFNAVGGLEIAVSREGVQRLEARCQGANAVGVPAAMISPEKAAELAPRLVKPDGVYGALHFRSDGTADARKITAFYQEDARKKGVQFMEADVKSLVIRDGRVTGVEINDDRNSTIPTDIAILTTGIWAQELCRDLDVPIPVVPVAHPYGYTHKEAKEPTSREIPWVRWPEFHVYARDHGPCYGLGSYNHQPMSHDPTKATALGEWVATFDSVLDSSCSLLPARENFQFETKLNGIFAMTPDNLPLVGAVPSLGGLYMATAVWVTHAAGAAKFLVKVIEGDQVDTRTRDSLDPTRFGGQDRSALEKESLRRYNDIYQTEEKH